MPPTARTDTPGWDALSQSTVRRKGGSAVPGRVTTLRYVLWTLIAAAALTVYVGHVHATRALLADVQIAQRDNLRLHLKYNRLKGEYDRQTGPAVIRQRARALGLVEDYQYGPTIRVTPAP